MKIISKKHDYYDCIQKYSIIDNESLIYLRKEKDINIDNIVKDIKILTSNLHFRSNKLDVVFDLFFIGFCGNIYPGIKVTKYIINYIGTYNPEYFYIYNINDLDSIIFLFNDKQLEKKYNKKYVNKYKQSWRNLWFSESYIRENIQKFFDLKFHDNIDEFIKNIKNFFIDYNTPVFYMGYDNQVHGYQLTINPILKEYDFYKIKDPFIAYQDISMYISGVLGVNTPETIKISDKDMLVKKGFDNKSFKTISPGKKKKDKRLKK